MVKILSHFLLERPELHQFVAHHIGIGGQTTFYTVYHIADHPVPILFLQVYDIQRKVVFPRNRLRQLYVLFRRAGGILAIHTYLYIEQMGLHSSFAHQMDSDRTIHASRNKQSRTSFRAIEISIHAAKIRLKPQNKTQRRAGFENPPFVLICFRIITPQVWLPLYCIWI